MKLEACLLLLAIATSYAQNSGLEQLILDKEAMVQNIKTQVLKAYRSRCDISCTCSLSACKSDLASETMECTESFGGEPECGAGCDAA